MNKMGKLIKAKTISFVDTLIKNYHSLNINEIEVMVLLLLYYQQEEGSRQLIINNLVSKTSLTCDELSNVILELVNKGFIELVIEDNGKEIFSIDMVYDMLGNILDDNDNPVDNQERKELISSIILYIETTYQRTLSSSDLIIINSWIDLQYTLEEIKEAILDSLKAKKMHLRYADAILANRHVKREEVEVNEELASILNKVYVKK